MSEERDTPTADPAAEQAPEAGAPVAETEPTKTEVLAAVDRAGDLAPEQGVGADPAGGSVEHSAHSAVAQDPTAAGLSSEAPPQVPVETAYPVDPAPTEAMPLGEATVPQAERPAIAVHEELPSAAAVPAAPAAPAQSGGMLISPDHPMAALYMQTPMPPDLKGNRGAGVLISLLAALGFAVVYAGVLALWLAPQYPPSTFLSDGLLPWVVSWPFIAAVLAFFVGMAVLVLIVGRAGWWAYVLGGFLVAVLVWIAFIGTVALLGTPYSSGGDASDLVTFVNVIGLSVPAIAAAVIAREATVWFGAWIGARGRKVTRRNAEAIAEYEQSLAEVQAKQV